MYGSVSIRWKAYEVLEEATVRVGTAIANYEVTLIREIKAYGNRNLRRLIGWPNRCGNFAGKDGIDIEDETISQAHTPMLQNHGFEP
jgi:hypothetical protein